MLQYSTLQNGEIALFTLNNPNKSANVINAEFATALQNAIQQAQNDPIVKGIIITSAKNTFLAGGDLERLYSLRHNAQLVFEEGQQLKAIFRNLETCKKTVVAAINGSALGGGYELALACHYRIALQNPKLQIGLPEVTLGLLPGAGGVVRLVRLLGLQAAFAYLSEGKKVTAETALTDGLIHAIAPTPDLLIQQAIDYIQKNNNPVQPWDAPDYKIPGGDARNPKVAQMLAIVPAMVLQKTKGNYPAPQAILNAAVESTLVDFETACRIESRYFTQLLTSNVANNLISTFWFQLNSINAGESRPSQAQYPPYTTQKVGVLGAGMMGAGIAYSTALAGIQVVLKDITIEAAQKGKAYSEELLTKQVQKKRITEAEKQAILNRILPTQNPNDLHNCDLIIEAVFENRELKAKVTQEAENQMLTTGVFASNTSTLPITGLANASQRPQQFIGLHFFSPVDKMQLVEIIMGKQTAPGTLAKAFDFVKQIKKTPIVVNDSRGFYTSRVFATYVMEGLCMLLEGNDPQLLENVAVKAGMPVGALALSDEVSISLMRDIRLQTQKDMESEGLPYEIHPAQTVLNKMVQLGRFGKKANAGFYEYPQNGKKYLWEELKNIFPKANNPLTENEIIERLMFVQALDTVRCMQEGVINSVADANIGSIFGWGFAPHKGGVLQYINDYGIKKFVQKSHELHQKYGKRFEVPNLLAEKAAKNELF